MSEAHAAKYHGKEQAGQSSTMPLGPDSMNAATPSRPDGDNDTDDIGRYPATPGTGAKSSSKA